jgi:hypothetical protein
VFLVATVPILAELERNSSHREARNSSSLASKALHLDGCMMPFVIDPGLGGVAAAGPKLTPPYQKQGSLPARLRSKELRLIFPTAAFGRKQVWREKLTPGAFSFQQMQRSHI